MVQKFGSAAKVYQFLILTTLFPEHIIKDQYITLNQHCHEIKEIKIQEETASQCSFWEFIDSPDKLSQCFFSVICSQRTGEMALTREALITATPTSVESWLVPWVVTWGEVAALAAGSQLPVQQTLGSDLDPPEGYPSKEVLFLPSPSHSPRQPSVSFFPPKEHLNVPFSPILPTTLWGSVARSPHFPILQSSNLTFSGSTRGNMWLCAWRPCTRRVTTASLSRQGAGS